MLTGTRTLCKHLNIVAMNTENCKLQTGGQDYTVRHPHSQLPGKVNSIGLTSNTHRQLKKIDKQNAISILNAVSRLVCDPSADCKPIEGKFKKNSDSGLTIIE